MEINENFCLMKKLWGQWMRNRSQIWSGLDATQLPSREFFSFMQKVRSGLSNNFSNRYGQTNAITERLPIIQPVTMVVKHEGQNLSQ